MKLWMIIVGFAAVVFGMVALGMQAAEEKAQYYAEHNCKDILVAPARFATGVSTSGNIVTMHIPATYKMECEK